MEKNVIPIVSIVGKSDSGKTTLIEKMIPELNKRGYRVATIKHNIHGFEIDHEGKDSWRHKKAGASITVISSRHRVALIEDVEKDYSIDELRDRFIKDVDVILVEGYKRNPYPKIEVNRKEMKQELLCANDDKLIAVVSNQRLDLDVPCIGMNDISEVVDIIEEHFLN